MSGSGWPLAMAVAGGALAAGALLGQACSDEPSAGLGGGSQGGAGGSGAGAITSSPASSSSSSSSSGSSDCPPHAPPPQVPDGWVEYADWSCDCRFYLPGSADVMPAPIAWEPCPANPGSSDCKLMKVDWTTLQTPVAMTPSFDRNPDGSGVLLFRRVSEQYLLDLVADVDGPARFAIMQARLPGEDPHNTDPGCMLEANQIHDGKYVYGVRGHDQHGHESESSHKGAIGGSLGQLVPDVLAHYQDDAWSYSWFHSNDWIARESAPSLQIYVMPWSMSPETFVTSAATDPENLMSNEPVMSGDALFWASSSLKRNGINVWDPVGGTRPFIRFIGDYTRGAADLGTDGVDLVWTYGEGKEPNDWVYPVRSIMTAPFTTDPAALQPRRLRSAPYHGIGNFQYAVGCGYAAHVADANNTIVVRLSDGVSWILPSHNPDFVPERPIGLTCDEVFILGQYGNMLTQIARFRLDSLGPGIAPD